MALSFSKVDDSKRWYLPDLPGNRQSEDPFAVEISCLSAQELRKLERASAEITKGQAGGFMERVEALINKVFCDHVHSVRGFDVEGVPTPTGGASLLTALGSISATPAKLIKDDILEAIQDDSKLKAGLLDVRGPTSGS